MASGKLSPRQKMINLMYLIFIAMLAIQVSPEVLTSFGLMEKKQAERNLKLKERNKAAYETLAQKATEQAKQFGEAKEKSDLIQEKSDKLFNQIEDLKKLMTANLEDKTNYEAMDKSDFLDSHFFISGKISPKGQSFLDGINTYREDITKILGKRELANVVASRFETKNHVKGTLKQNWLNYNYEKHPLVASLTKLTQLQADIRTTEAEALSSLLEKELTEAVSMTNFDAMVIFDKNAYYAGEKLSGKIVLGKNDPNLTAERVILNGKEVAKSKIQAGQVLLDGSAGSVGDHDLKGEFMFREGDSLVKIPIKGSYAVIPKPNEAVISADKMNVVYKGLTNPMTISIPGIPSNKVSASAPGLTKSSGSKYNMRPTGAGGTDVTIKVSGKLPDGTPISSNKKFRVKDIPPAVGIVRGQFGTVRMPKSSAGRITVAAGLPDFLFDLKLQVLSYKVKVPGQLTVNGTGSQLSAKAKSVINKARRGDQITIYDIKAKVTNSSYQLKKVLPVNIEITN